MPKMLVGLPTTIRAVLGAKFGYASIPDYYIENLHNKDRYDRKVSEFITFLEFHLSNHI